MKQLIIDEIRRFVKEDRRNYFPDSDQPYFEEPLVGFVSANDPLFLQYKTIIGDFHLTPQEIIDQSVGSKSWQSASVICWVLPITTATKMTNRVATIYPSKEWSQTRSYGEKFNVSLRLHIVDYLISKGYHAVAPQLSPVWKKFEKTPVGIASSWSERHAAYAAGLGTFSLNDALITSKGIAHRLGSIITDVVIPPSKQIYSDYRANCLFYREQSCRACISRCPVGALSINGHDKRKCYEYVYGTLPAEVGEFYQVPETGCGLCQTKVPCEGQIPKGHTL